MGSEIVRVVAGEPYRHPEACHGPCYVLCPAAWSRGERVVLEIVPAHNPPPVRASLTLESLLQSPQTRRIVVWRRGAPHDWWFENVPVRRPEPAWARRARELRAAGWSERRIMQELGIASKRALGAVLGRE